MNVERSSRGSSSHEERDFETIRVGIRVRPLLDGEIAEDSFVKVGICCSEFLNCNIFDFRRNAIETLIFSFDVYSCMLKI